MSRNGKSTNLARWQAKYLTAAAAVLPVSPLLYLQGLHTRRKVGLLPEAAGEKTGIVGQGESSSRLLVLGESTVAGLGARTHKEALAGQFAARLADRIGQRVEWTVVGRNGVTARRTIDELLPLVPGRAYAHILLGIGGNDVMKLSSPKKWRRDMIELLSLLRGANPDAVIFISNCPMIVYSPVIPNPIKFLLWELSKMHDANIREFTADIERVHYYPQPADVTLEGFFADGIHPSEQGYSDWAEAMMRYFDTKHRW
ncbi:MAG TPA: SGNH/GDSL hydrolase family protein [Pyrinomonadaceae bacterium]|nr:SGNH/GDSL hydrolase family protein [Pyrinomonadaceae bacterium]